MMSLELKDKIIADGIPDQTFVSSFALDSRRATHRCPWGETNSGWSLDYVYFKNTVVDLGPHQRSSTVRMYALRGVVSPRGRYYHASEIYGCREISYTRNGILLDALLWDIGSPEPIPRVDDNDSLIVSTVFCPIPFEVIQAYEDRLEEFSAARRTASAN